MKKFNFKLIIYLIPLALTTIGYGQTVLIDEGDVWRYLYDGSSQGTFTQLRDETSKAPYLIYTGENTGMQVLWQLVSTDTCTIEWGIDTLYTIGTAQTYEYGSDHQHMYTITNLTPDSIYYYRMTVNQEVHTGSFRSAPDSNATSLKFIAYGDTRSYPAVHDSVADAIIEIYKNDGDFQSFILATGDLVNNGDSELDWYNQFFNPSYLNIQEMLTTLPYQSCMGNHEGTGVLFIKYFPYPFVAGRYWSFDYGPAHFVVVDQYTDYGPGSAQLTWIENDLASTTKLWKFVCLHEPGWSSGGHENNSNVQNNIQPLCDQYGVSILFAGHNHYYARAIVNNVQHITTGGGGAPLYAPIPDYPNVVYAERTHHFCKIEIENDSLDFEAVTPSGTVIDSFTITLPIIVEVDRDETPIQEFTLYPAFPNPFNSSTTLTFSIPTDFNVELNLYNIQGQKIKTLVNEKLEAGYHSYSWNGKNNLGQNVNSGVYFYKIQAGDKIQGGKIILLK